MDTKTLEILRSTFKEHLQEQVIIANYTTSHVGGVADAVLIVHNKQELENAARLLWQVNVPFMVFGNGSNILVSDQGYRGVIILNQAREIHIRQPRQAGEQPSVWAESGANLGSIARRAALRGFGGLEWAAGIPATVGGAVYGNAGAHGSDIKNNLILAEILHRTKEEIKIEMWSSEMLEYEYRSSIFKRQPGTYGGNIVILAADLKLVTSQREIVQAKIDEINEKRRSTQPPGASTGSTFKNPPGDYAGRLIEAAGLKGTRIGGAEISPVHANFIVNQGYATANDYYQLIRLVQRKVEEKFGVKLEPEIEFIGEWHD